MSPALASYAKQPLPTKMPDGGLTLDVKAGEMLFLPRGWWHATEALEDSWAVAFGLRTPAWGFYLVEEVIAHVFKDIAARRYPRGLNAKEREAVLLEEATAAIERLRRVASEITAEALLEILRARVPGENDSKPKPRPAIALK
jgi:ribosomal protein L16 Arg81 hydroxylase